MRDFEEEYQHMKVTLVGEKSYGKGIMQTTVTLSDESTVTLTVAYYNPPSGENYHGEGITPDVIVKNENGGDAQLEAAYDEIHKLIN
jgi:carboxyl-terminal processing protease